MGTSRIFGAMNRGSGTSRTNYPGGISKDLDRKDLKKEIKTIFVSEGIII